MKRAVVALALVLVLLVPILLLGVLLAAAGEELAPSQRAMQEVPGDLLALYRTAAATCEGLDWTILAAIHKVETGFGRGRAVSSAGAQGPMQFMPATWRAYGVDGDGDALANINDVEDAIFSAAHLLCANGAGDPARLRDAIWNYNHSDSYVVEVLELAAPYGVVSFEGMHLATASSDILANSNILVTANARADLEAGMVDARILALLDLLARRHTIGISVLKSGHSKYVAGTTSISNHFYGRAVDISYVDGSPVSAANDGARQVVNQIAILEGALRPSEVGHPFATLRFAGSFSDADHRGHIHIGFE